MSAPDRFRSEHELAVAFSTRVATAASDHLLRTDGQEDVCFALWHPSTGIERSTGIIHSLVLPRPGERSVHGNADFTSSYFLRAARIAASQQAGVALLHSHPGGLGWQGLSSDDYAAEASHAGQTVSLTGLPILGLTLASDGHWSARFWRRAAARTYEPIACRNVRVAGGRLKLSFDPMLAPVPEIPATQRRTVAAWGPLVQADFARLRVGVIGAGSVASLVAEALARTGVGDVRILDFDTLETHNLDRQLHARTANVGASKAQVLAAAIEPSATAPNARVQAYDDSVVEPDGLRRTLDCDVLFSCVDRPWPRAALNLVAYAHLIPVVDGGVRVDARGGRFRGANWRAHVAAPGRRCLECLGQYDPGLVQAERDGLLDDPKYIEGLPETHELRRSENVFAFSMGCASLELAQFIAMIAAPSAIADVGAQHYDLTTGTIRRDEASCKPTCPYEHDLAALGDDAPVTVTGRHVLAELRRAERAARWVSLSSMQRIATRIRSILWRFTRSAIR